MISGCLVVYFFIKSALTKNLGVKNDLIYFILFSILLSGLIQATYGLLQLYGYYPSNHGQFKITGSFFNPAPFALYLATIFPMALAIYTFVKIPNIHEKPNLSIRSIFSFIQTKYFLLSALKQTAAATAISIIIVLPATMIRAAWVGAIAGLLIVFLLALKHKKIELPQSFVSILTSKINRILLVALGITIIGGSSLFLYKVKEKSSKGKSLIWEITMDKITDKPIFGHGVGRFEAEYNNWQGEYFTSHPSEITGDKGLVAGNTKYCFNEYLELASETGIVGVVLFFAFIGTILFYSIKNNSIINAIILPTMVALLVFAAISYPFYNIPLQLLFFIMAATLYINSRAIIIVKPFYTLRYVYGLTLGMLALFIATHLYYKQIAYSGWKEAQFVYNLGNYTEANKMYQSNLANLQYEGLFLQEYGKSLQMNNDSNAIRVLTQASLLTSDYVLYCTLGDAYKSTKDYKHAENAYQKASKMVPHKLYPHYLLAKLYEISGNNKTAVTKAIEVLNMVAKTESRAEKEIKAEMKNIIERNEILQPYKEVN